MDLEQLVTALISNSRTTFKSGDKARLLKMDPLDFADLIINSQVAEQPKEFTVDDAKALIEQGGLVVNAKKDVELYEANKADFAAFMEQKKADRESLICDLVTNSKLTKDALEAMSDDVLKGIKESIVPQQDFSARGPQIVNERQTQNSSVDDHADYH